MSRTLDWWDQKAFPPWVIMDRLADIILSYVGGCIVEIGLGKSTFVLSRHAKNFGVKHYAIDTSQRKIDEVLKSGECDHDGLVIYNGRSLDFIKEFDDDLGLVFVDGCHKPIVVRQEADFFIDKLLPGGVIFFHDMFLCKEWGERHASIGKYSSTYEVRLELEKRDDIWCLTFPYTAVACGLTLVLKRPEFEYSCEELKKLGFEGDWTYKGQVV